MIYYLGKFSQHTVAFTYDDRTIEQIKNSGGIRLIRSKESIDKIMDYYRRGKRIQWIEDREGPEQEGYK